MTKSKNLEFHTEKRKVKDLIPFEYNPRKLSDKQREDLKASLEKFGLAEIPVINTDNKICAGHQRVETLALLGREDETIDVRVPSREMTEEEFYEYNIRSNKNTGSWDYEALNVSDFSHRLVDWGFEEFELLGNNDELAFMDEDVQTPSDNRGGNSTGGYKIELGGFTQYYKEDTEECKLLAEAGEKMMSLNDDKMNEIVRKVCSLISNS